MLITNLRLFEQLSELEGEKETFSFVNTFIVLQHIEPKRGLSYLAQLLKLLSKGGCGSLHMTYARAKDSNTHGQRRPISHAAQAVRRPLSALHRTLAGRDPEMQMNAYPMNKVLYELQTSGITELFSEFTDHGGHFGITISFRKP